MIDPDHPDHEHFEICPPVGTTPKCPECGNAVESLAVCTYADLATITPCEHEIGHEQFIELAVASLPSS